MEFTPEKAFNGKRLINHVIRIVEVMKKEFCENVCFMEPNCVSINLEKRVDGNGNYKCELNNATHEGHEDELKKEENYFYHAAEVVATSLKNLPFHKSKYFYGYNIKLMQNFKLLHFCINIRHHQFCHHQDYHHRYHYNYH